MSVLTGRQRFLEVNALPLGWSTATIADLVGHDGIFIDGDWVETVDQDPSGEIRLIQLADVGDGDYRNRSSRFMNLQRAMQLHCTFLNEGDVLIARMAEPLGRACIFPGDTRPCVTVVDICVIRTGRNGVDHGWLMNALNSPTVRSMVSELQSGTTRQRISRRNLASIALNIPPIAEQRRIVAAIEEQFIRLDSAVASLEQAQAKLKRYRATVLKAAVEGKLTEVWRAANPPTETAPELLRRMLSQRKGRWEADQRAKGKDPAKMRYDEPGGPDVSEMPDLPASWGWATIGQAASHITKGTSPKWQGFDYVEDGIPFIRSQNVRWGATDLSTLVYLPAEFNESHENSIIETGDVLLNLVGASVGRSAVAPPEANEANTNQAVGIIRTLTGSLNNWFLVYYLISPPGQHYIGSTKADVARANFNLDDIYAMPVMIPTHYEQEVIVNEIELRLSVVTELESSIDANLKRAGHLRQSILREALAGRLVAQDPADEPASVLLERIRAEWEAAPLQPSPFRRGSKRKPERKGSPDSSPIQFGRQDPGKPRKVAEVVERYSVSGTDGNARQLSLLDESIPRAIPVSRE